MPKILVEVPDTVESILRPVVLDVTRTIFGNTQVTKDVRILFPGDIDRAQQQGGSLSSAKSPDPIKFPFTSQFSIEVSEEYLQDRMLVNAVMRPENLFIYRDDRIESFIRPVYSMTETTLTFKYRAKDKTEAIRWRDDMRNRTAENRQQFLHDVKYHYLIPESMLVILKELWRMREAVAGYDDTWEDYFKSTRTTRCHFLTNQAGAGGRWGIAESQLRIQGWFDFEGVPEPGGKEDEADTWTISFNYKFQYDKALACVMYYPLMIHNQLLDQKYRPGPEEQPPYQVEDQLRSYSLSAKMLGYFESTNTVYQLNNKMGYAVPTFDEFVPAQILPGTLRVVTMMLEIDPQNPRFLMNLKDLGGDLKLDPSMYCCLEKEWPFMCQPRQSIFNLSLYQNADLMQNNFITIDKDLNIWSTVDLNIRKYYHVRLSLYKDPNFINPAAMTRLLYCPTCLTKILTAIDPRLQSMGLIPAPVTNPGGQPFISPKALQPAIQWLGQATTVKGNNQPGYNLNTVQTLFVTALRNPNTQSNPPGNQGLTATAQIPINV